MLNIAITNLGKYNEGVLVFKWVDLARFVSWDDLEASPEMAEIGIGSLDEFGQPYEEWFVSDWECDIPGLEYTEYPGRKLLGQWCELAKAWNAAGDDAHLAVRVYASNETSLEPDEVLDLLKNYADGELVLYTDMGKEDVARHWYDEGLIFDLSPEQRRRMQSYIDWVNVAEEYCNNLIEDDGNTVDARW